MMARPGVSMDTSGLDRLMAKIGAQVDERLEMIAFDLQDEIDANYSAVSPSDPGEPPAIVSETLLYSSKAERIKSGEWEVSVGDQGDGEADYAAIQEFGSVNQEPRPFFGPAIDRLQDAFGEHFEGMFDD